MATLTTDKIISELKNYFEDKYQYVFWYDDKAQFKDIIDQIASNLNEVRLYKAQANQQFKTKIDLLSDSQHKYLIYAPYERPRIQENYLTDLEHYSKLFTADATQIILEELNLSVDKLSFVKQYHAFFGAKDRRKNFIKYWSVDFDTTPEKGIIAAITKTEKLDINELLMKIIAAGKENNQYLFLFAKYNVLDYFWKLVGNYFGYDTIENANLDNLINNLFFTYLDTELDIKNSNKFQNLLLSNKDNVQIFIDRFADSNKYNKYYISESNRVWNELKLHDLLVQESLSDLTKVTVFEEVNSIVLTKIRDKFIDNQVTDYEQVLNIIDRMSNHTRNNFSNNKENEYKFLCYSAELFNLRIPLFENWQKELDGYINNEYQIDTIYRKILLAYTRIDNNDLYSKIKKNIDLYYGNILLNSSVKQWNNTFDLSEVPSDIKQERFYHNHVSHVPERVVVIFSDALRFEVGKELEDELDNNDRLTLNMKYALTSLPSVTYMGMNVMLPHNRLRWDAKKHKVKVDDKNAENTSARDKILKTFNESNTAAQLKDILEMTSKEVKTFINGKNLIYLYHNQIDAKGHELKTTKELVDATEKAIEEIKKAIQALRTNGVSHIIVTADHGFIYQERPIYDTDKIDLANEDYLGNAHLRYLITPDKLSVRGVKSTTMGISLSNDDKTNIYYPTSPNEFIAKSGSKNYVHGGSSIQEMLIPILDIKATSRKSAAQPAKIKLAATTFRINSLKMNLLFNQIASVSDRVLPTEYNVFFVDEDEKMISNKVVVEANRKGSAADRTLPVTITIQNTNYNLNKKYYLVIENQDTNYSKKIEYTMDIFSNN